jgi:hypothetical protein
LSGNTLGVVSMRGYGTSAYHGSATARILAYAMENFTNSAGGTDLSFHVTPIGSITSAEAMRLVNTGNVTFTNKVSIGTATPLYLLDIRGRDSSSQIHVASADADSGGYIRSYGSASIGMSGGAAWSVAGASWVAKETVASLLFCADGRIDLYANSGLTPGNAYTPARRLVVYPSGGLAFGSSVAFTDPGDSNIVTAGWISATGGFATTGVATNIMNAASGGVTAKWLIGTTSLTLAGETAANAGPSSAGQGRLYFDSTVNKFKVSENGGAYVDLVGTGSALPSGTSGQTLRHNGTAWVASSVFTNDGSPKITRAGQSHLYFTSAAGTGGFLIGRCYGSDDANDFFIYDLTASAKRFGIDSAGSVTAAGTLQANRVIETRGGLGSRQGYEMSDANEMRDVGFYAAGASTLNKPSGAVSYGTVLVSNYYGNTRGQLYMNTQPGCLPYIWARASATWGDDANWQAWVRVLVEDYNGDVSVTRKLTAGGDVVTNGGRFYCDVASQPALTLKQSGTVRAAFFYDESDAKTKIARYSDAGGYVGSAVAITRATGDVALERALTVAGVAGAAGLTVSAGWVQCAGGYQTTGTAADILNAASGGLTSRYVVLSAAVGTPNLSIQGVATANAPAAPATGWSRIYMDSTTGKLRVSENGGAYVDLVGTGGSLPSGTSGQTLRHNGTSWVASSIFINDGSPKITRAGQSHLYFTSAAGTGGFLIGRSYGSDDANDFFIYDLTASAKRFGIDSAGSVTAAGALQVNRVIEARGGLGSRQGYEMSDANEMRDIGFYAAGASTSNKPAGASSYGAVLVNNYFVNTRGQLYMNTQPGVVPYLWARASATWSDDNQWQAWVRVLVEDYNGDVSVTRKLTAASDIVTNGQFYCDVASQPALTLKQSGTVRAAFFYDESDAKTKIARYSDAGGYVGSAVAITRATGDVALERALTVAGVAGAAGLTVSAGWVQCAGGFQTTGTATDIINAASGGVTSRYLVLSAAAGTPNLSIQEGTAPALPSSGWSRLYMDSGTHKLMVSQNGAAAVGLLDRLTSINSQTGSAITLQGYTNEIAVSTPSSNTVQIRLATNIEAQGTVRLVGGHLYLANNYSIYFRDTSGNDRVAITRSSDNHLYIDNVDNNGDIYLRPANSRYVIIGQGSSCNAFLLPNTAGGTNSVGTATYPWDEVNSATYKYGNTLLINSSGQFVGLGVSMTSYGCGASGFNCYSGGWKTGRTVTLYDRDGNAMNFYGGILAS